MRLPRRVALPRCAALPRRTALIAGLTAAACLTGGTASAAPATPRAAVHLPAAIDPLQPYVGQDSCDATAKPGAVALLALLMKTYRGSTSLGIVATCAAEGMRSEHSEGRALDWGVNVRKPAQRGQAEAMLTWLFADQRQSDGTVATQVMARRLGVMYVIWNGRIREAGGGWEPYLPGTCSKGGKAIGDDTTCHRNHVHISLGWSGAWKRTSFWTGRVAPIDFGPCVAKGKKVAPRYSRFNPAPCGTSGRGGQPAPPPVAPLPLPVLPLPPVTLPPVTTPPVSLPPVSLPPVSLPPVSLPPVTTPPPVTVPAPTPPATTSPAPST